MLVITAGQVARHPTQDDGPTQRTRAGPSSRLHPVASGGPHVVAPHSHAHVTCRPREHAMVPTSIRPGMSG